MSLTRAALAGILATGLELPEPDLGALETRAQRDLEIIPGCHELDLAIEQRMRVPGLDDDQEAYTATARLDEGVWEVLRWEAAPEAEDNGNITLEMGSLPFPLPAAGTQEGGHHFAPVDFLLEHIKDPVELVTVEPSAIDSADVYQLNRRIRIRRRSQLDVQSWIPVQGPTRRWAAQLDGKLPMEPGKVRDLDWRLDVDELGRPTSQALSATFSFGPLRLHYAGTTKTLAVRPC